MYIVCIPYAKVVETTSGLLGLDCLLMGSHVSCLIVNPASGTQCVPVLGSKVVTLVVDNMLIHEFVQLVKVVEWHYEAKINFL